MRIGEAIRLFDGPAPGSDGGPNRERRWFSELWATEVVANVSVPTFTPVWPDGAASGVAVVIAPGGGFHALSIQSEGYLVAERLAAVGITSFVLAYRTVPAGDDPVADLVHKMMTDLSATFADMAAQAPLAGIDGAMAMRTVRARAEEFGIDPARTGILGFSAGGNVAVRVAYAGDPEVRPAFVGSIYATAHGVELGEPPVGSGPLFAAVATDDTLGLTDDSLAIYDTWRRARLPAELHAYARGGHGFGMRRQGLPSDGWIDRFIDWHHGLA
jgi:acetyl esterase/lipase